MRITLDSSFDSGAWPGPLAGRSAVAGEAWLGPMGCLGTLETLLGLARSYPSTSERSAALIPILLTTQGFWSASAKADPLATAQLLVSWADALSIEGWLAQPVSPRLEQLAKVTKGIAPGIADRLRSAAHALATGAAVLESVELLEPRASFPLMWRQLFGALEKSGTRIREAPISPAAASPGSDLLAARSPGFSPKADGSLQLIRPYGPLDAADAVAAALAVEPDVPTIFIHPEPVLDAALKRHGLPTTGAAGSTGDNALLQLLPLVVALGWKPADPARVYELLTLRESPIRVEVRWRLLRALQKYPAVDSDGWRDALAKGLEEIDEPTQTERLEILLTGRVAHGAPYPLGELTQRVGALAAWLQARLAVAKSDDEAARFGAALGQCGSFLSLVALAGMSQLADAQLRRFIDEATAAASGPVLHPVQAGFASLRASGALAGPAPRVVWWRFDAEAAPVPHPLPLTKAERAGLAALGVVLPDAAALGRREVERWRRPLLQTSQSLWLVCPQRAATGEAAEPHPVWDEVVGRFAAGVSKDALEVDRPRLKKKLPQSARKELSLLGPRSAWKTSVKLQRRDKESPSSVAAFLGCSFQWAVQRVGDVGAGQTGGIPGGAIMLGNLAHRILERVMKGPALAAAEGEAEAERLFEVEGPRLAAPLFLPGWRQDRNEASSAIARSAGALCELRQQGWEPESVEEEIVGKAFGTVFAGTADVVLKRGRVRAVVDYKWGSRAKHLSALRGGTALQLSAYAELLEQTKGEAPHVAYLVVRDGRLLTSSQQLTDAHLAVQGPPLADTWAGLKQAHAGAWKVFAKGALTAPGASAESRDEDALEDGVLGLQPPCFYCSFGGLCGKQFGAEASDDEED